MVVVSYATNMQRHCLTNVRPNPSTILDIDRELGISEEVCVDRDQVSLQHSYIPGVYVSSGNVSSDDVSSGNASSDDVSSDDVSSDNSMSDVVDIETSE